ncbi:hypothetical protein ABIA35_002502 [Catenulispora sp. MAP12-49]|uniref:hypothetical protein n=1 Tax=Catenulispora sp. MAP12-49 TaxID=3156302 RepID=UPI00351669FD
MIQNTALSMKERRSAAAMRRAGPVRPATRACPRSIFSPKMIVTSLASWSDGRPSPQRIERSVSSLTRWPTSRSRSRTAASSSEVEMSKSMSNGSGGCSSKGCSAGNDMAVIRASASASLCTPSDRDLSSSARSLSCSSACMSAPSAARYCEVTTVAVRPWVSSTRSTTQSAVIARWPAGMPRTIRQLLESADESHTCAWYVGVNVPMADALVVFTPSIPTANTAERTSAPTGIAPVVVHGIPDNDPLSGPLAGITRFLVAFLAMNPISPPPQTRQFEIRCQMAGATETPSDAAVRGLGRQNAFR